MMYRSCFALIAVFTGALVTAPLRGDDNPPLVVLQLSEETLNRFLNETIERETAVDNVILGTHVVGKAKTTGQAQLRLMDSDAGPAVLAVFSGVTNSRTVGDHFPVTIYSRSKTDFTVEQLIAIDPTGNMDAQPAKVRVHTKTVTEKITTHRRGLLGRIVLRRAARAVAANAPEANAIAQRDVERQIVKLFEAALESRIEQAQMQKSLRKLVAAALHADTFPAIRAVTNGGYLTVAVFARAPEEKVVAANLPHLPLKNEPVQIWLHRSLVGANSSTGEINVDVARRWLTLPTFLGLAANDQPQSGPSWIAVDNWYAVPFSRQQTVR